MPICYDVQVIYKKHDSMIVVFLIHYSIDKFEP